MVAFAFVLLGNEAETIRGSFFSVFIFLVAVAIFVAGVTLLFEIGFALLKLTAVDVDVDVEGLVIVALLKSLLRFGVALAVGGVDEKTFVG